jgi:phosphate transport system protein
MADRTGTILERALDALVRQDAVTAREVLIADRKIDTLYRRLLEELKILLRDREHLDERLEAVMLLFSVARHLERLADHATNIAEDVLYMVEGEIQRHRKPPARPGTTEELLTVRDLGFGGESR